MRSGSAGVGRIFFGKVTISNVGRLCIAIGVIAACIFGGLSFSTLARARGPQQLFQQLAGGAPLTDQELERLREMITPQNEAPEASSKFRFDEGVIRTLLLCATVGTLLFSVGLSVGLLIERRSRAATASALDANRALNMFVDLFQAANNVQGDVSKAREFVSQVTHIANAAKEANAKQPNDSNGDDTTQLLKRLVGDNRHLQKRLDEAESTLKEQAGSLEKYLTEARTDGLTRLPNRRAFDDELNRRWAEFRRYNKAFCVLLIDVDNFKLFNDTFGHLAGDAVLAGVAQALQATMRQTDLVARYGGEEFAVVVGATGPKEAALAAERARLAIEAAIHEVDGQVMQVTASCGIAQIATGEGLAELVKRADDALYASKHGGRNRSHWHDGRECQLIQHSEVLAIALPNNASNKLAGMTGIPPEFQQVCAALTNQLDAVLKE